MWPNVLSWTALVLAAIPAAMFVWNLFFYRRPRPGSARFAVSILIPARNEERTIASSVRAALHSRNVDLEVLVLDDHSGDATAAIVQTLSREDPRVRLVHGLPLPPGWCGKQHACAQLAEAAQYPVFCFIDADVCLEPGCIAAMTAAMVRGSSSLISGFPRQQTVTFWERLLIPLMHFLLLGYLPMFGMRKTVHPSFGAGCGQILIADRNGYRAAGGHAAIRSSRHDGIKLPRAFRAAGLRTDLCDITGLAHCRMYHDAAEVFSGLSKNATEGLAAPSRILPFSLLLFGGAVLPFLLLLIAPGFKVAAAVLIAYLPRLLAAARFRQPVGGALLHPVAVVALLCIQWIALGRSLMGLPSTWKGRKYLPGAAQ